MEARRKRFLLAVQERVSGALRPALSSDATEQMLSEAMNVAYSATTDNIAIIEKNAEHQRSRGVAIPQIACKKGCDYCCFVRVRVSIPEVLNIADHVRATFSPEEQEALMSRLETYAEEYKGLSVHDRLNKMIACPLLVDHECSVHSVRPIACRAHHSIDLEECKRAFLDPENVQIPHFLEVDTLVAPVTEGIRGAVRAKNLKGSGIALAQGLRIALADKDASSKWLAGEDVFAKAVDHELVQLAQQVQQRSRG